jgi:hypothetical protein
MFPQIEFTNSLADVVDIPQNVWPNENLIVS